MKLAKRLGLSESELEELRHPKRHVRRSMQDMARPIRIECAHTFYHVMSRGNERRDIFRDGRDYERFCELLELLCERFEV